MRKKVVSVLIAKYIDARPENSRQCIIKLGRIWSDVRFHFCPDSLETHWRLTPDSGMGINAVDFAI